jgi:hypothetical protein
VKRRLLNLLTAVSLLLCVASCVLWVRSHSAAERWRRTLSWTSSLYVDSDAGKVSVVWHKWWITAGHPPYRWVRQERRSLPFRWRTLGFDGEWIWQDERQGNIRATRSATLPYWFMTVMAAVPPAVHTYRRLRRRSRAGLCPRCDYDLRATPGRCPECGSVTAAGSTAG